MLSDQQRDIICTQNGFGRPTTRRSSSCAATSRAGPGSTSSVTLNYRLLGGLRGDINPTWNYDVYGMHGQGRLSRRPISTTSTPLASQDALDVVGDDRNDPSTWRCRSGNAGCVPWNIFTIGGVTPESTRLPVDDARLQLREHHEADQRDREGGPRASGVKLPSATEGVSVVLGVEMREEGLFQNFDDILPIRPGVRAGRSSELNVDGSYSDATRASPSCWSRWSRTGRGCRT